MFGKYNGSVSKARVSACMYFLVNFYSCTAWNNVPKVPDHGDRQSWLSLLFSGWKPKPCFSADHNQFLADHWSVVNKSVVNISVLTNLNWCWFQMTKPM
jgi:hypothetical protein